MGGFTKVQLSDTSPTNIDRHNARLAIYGVPKKYRFYTERDVVEEYEWYLAKRSGLRTEGVYPSHLFPADQINSFEDFCKFWNTKAVGPCFVPPFGALTFDCYFGRMSKGAMRAVAKYLLANIDEFASVSGSFSTFMERGMTEQERQQWDSYGVRAA